MKVKDLILRLQACNPEHIVVIDGYEGGVTELASIIDDTLVALNVNEAYYYGPHELVVGAYKQYEGSKIAQVVYLPRS